MLSSVLHSKQAIEVNIEIMRAVVFEAIHQLIDPPEPKKKNPIGFA